MNLLNSFIDFYKSLSTDGLFFFWIVLFLFVFLIFLCVVLLVKNNNLTKLLKEERSIPSVPPVMEDTSDENPIVLKDSNLEEPPKEVNSEVGLPPEESTHPINEVSKEEVKVEATGPYSKNILRQMSARTQTSPIHIDRREPNETTIQEFQEEPDNLSSPLEELDDQYETSDNMLFASEIVRKMEEEIKPSNIELTDYEKKQEEEAIISYDELLKVKDKIYNITEDEEDSDFIDELKSFRLDLK